MGQLGLPPHAWRNSKHYVKNSFPPGNDGDRILRSDKSNSKWYTYYETFGIWIPDVLTGSVTNLSIAAGALSAPLTTVDFYGAFGQVYPYSPIVNLSIVSNTPVNFSVAAYLTVVDGDRFSFYMTRSSVGSGAFTANVFYTITPKFHN